MNGDTARARFQIVEYNERRDNGDISMILGAYDDEYVRRDGKWMFHRRRFSLRNMTVIANTHRS